MLAVRKQHALHLVLPQGAARGESPCVGRVEENGHSLHPPVCQLLPTRKAAAGPYAAPSSPPDRDRLAPTLLFNMQIFETGFFPTLSWRETALSLPRIKVQHFNSHSEVKFGGPWF